jgi:hypothetical protein
LTAPSETEISNIVLSNDGKIIAFNRVISVEGSKEGKKQIYMVRLDDEK